MSVGNRTEEQAEGPLPQIVAGSIEKLLAWGSERGYVTYDELSATLALDQLSSEEIEDAMRGGFYARRSDGNTLGRREAG